MKAYHIIIVLSIMLGLSCTDNLDSQYTPTLENYTPLEIAVTHRPLSKAQLVGNYLPDGAELGIFLRAADGSRYGSLSLQSVRYTATGTGASQAWKHDENHPIGLTTQLGTAYAYYPCQQQELNNLKVPITNDGTDWMYGEPETGLSAENNLARFEMTHAMCIVRCKIVKGDVVGTGHITTVGVTSEGLAQTAAMDLATAKVTDFAGINTEIATYDIGYLSDTPINTDLWCIPTGTAASLNIRVVVDGNVYRAPIPPLTMEGGYVYQYAVTVNSHSLTVSGVSIQPWSSETGGRHETEVRTAWRMAKETDGVYAIDAYGKPISYEQATASSYAGVAFVVRGKAYQVAKTDAAGSDGTKLVYWWKDNYIDIPTLPNYIRADGISQGGYLGIELPVTDPNDWAVGALSDFNGKANTELIIAAQTQDEVILDDTVAKAVVDFRNDPAVNDDYTDWFLPAEGELCTMYCIYREPIQTMLAKIPGGNILGLNHNCYISSTEQYETTIWVINNTQINTLYKYSAYACRLIREIE